MPATATTRAGPAPSTSWKSCSPKPVRVKFGSARYATAQDRLARRMDRGAQGVACQGKGADPAARPAQRRTPRPAMGQGREALRLRYAERQADAGRAVRGPQ